jgi:DNA-binding transcriptional LysR family regulator
VRDTYPSDQWADGELVTDAARWRLPLDLLPGPYTLAIRVGELEDSTLRARKLTETVKRMVGSPSYFEKYGRPTKIDDLNEHKLLHYSNQASGNVWKITAPSGEKRQVRTAGWLTVNDGQSLLNAAISGLGIAYLPSFLYADAMKQGLVVDAIPDLPVETLGIYAVYPPGRFTQPKVRAFIDFIVPFITATVRSYEARARAIREGVGRERMAGASGARPST